MDLGLTTGNAFIISTPPEVKTELGLYIHLYLSKTARTSLVTTAAKVRTRSWSDVWAHHDTLMFPLIIYPTTTKEVLLETIVERAHIIIANRSNHL